jgi:transposase-like protein
VRRARELGVSPKTARYWRKRWRDADGKCAVCERLADAPRSGAPATYTPEQTCAVVAMTCEKPSESERPISQWTQREITDEAIRRGLVPNISQRSVGLPAQFFIPGLRPNTGALTFCRENNWIPFAPYDQRKFSAPPFLFIFIHWIQRL